MSDVSIWRECLQQYPFCDTHHDAFVITYQPMHAPELVRVAERYAIHDAFRGNSDLERILSLMNLVHGISQKGGQNTSPTIKNTDEIMKAAKNGSLWCSDYATVLMETLLSMGVKATRITCMPYSFDCDRHVGVMAYLNDIGKWAYFDPTFNTYFYNALPLDVFEIRSAYARGMNPAFRHIPIEKNWVLMLHDVAYESYDMWYSDYMLKNTFRFACPMHSAYGGCSFESMFLYLAPTEYYDRNEYDMQNAVYSHDPGCLLRS